MPDDKGETRRERNVRFGLEQSPQSDVPLNGLYLWDWYWTISSRLRRVRDGFCEPIPPSEFNAWCEASATIIYPVEYGILCAMDEAFCTATNQELSDYRARQDEQRKAEMEAAKSRGSRGRRGR